MRHHIITTVGTSFITNNSLQCGIDVDSSFMAKPVDAYFENDRQQSHIRQKLSVYSKSVPVVNHAVISAEIAGIIAYIQELPDDNLYKINDQTDTKISVHLIATDTYGSWLCTILIAEFLNDNINDIFGKKFNNATLEVNTVKISQLQINDTDAFREQGLENLIRKLDNIIGVGEADKNLKKYKGNNKYVLNISGGYKGIIPVVTLYAQLYKVPLIYLYKDVDAADSRPSHLITIESLPLNIDNEQAQDILYFIHPANLADPEFIRNESNRTFLNTLCERGYLNKEGKRYRRTAAGQLLLSYAVHLGEAEKDLLSFVLEYKLFEFFIQGTDFYSEYDSLERGYETIFNDSIHEIDLLFNSGNNDFCAIGEIKTLNQLINDKGRKKTIGQFEKNIKAVEAKMSKKVNQLMLFLYGFAPAEDERICTLKKVLIEHPFNIPMDVFYIQVKIKHNPGENIYQEFYKKSLDKKDLKKLFSLNPHHQKA